jgi:hypothetical protein
MIHLLRDFKPRDVDTDTQSPSFGALNRPKKAEERSDRAGLVVASRLAVDPWRERGPGLFSAS